MIPKGMETHFAFFNLIHCRLTPTRPWVRALQRKVAYLVVTHFMIAYL
ncbi:MAG: hypothetical protein LBK82_14365 [Planctomycetaceae bacterium]|nr:hypothetical protein [Planctomycetaceae bacterium]